MVPLSKNQVMLMALTFVFVIVIALCSPDLLTACAVVAALGMFAWAYLAASNQKTATADPLRPLQEGFTTALPGGTAPMPVETAVQEVQNPWEWGGAIDADDYDSEAQYGHRDRTEGDNENAPEGNLFNRNRISIPVAGAPGMDDEANSAEMDADELGAYHGRSRNDAERVAAGTSNRRRAMDKYFREEMDASENRSWWGRQEE